MKSNTEVAHSGESSGAAILKNSAMAESAGEAHGFYTVECFDKDGNLKWSEDFENLVTTEGKNFILDKVLAGSAYTAAWYVGLINTGASPAAGDTLASHAGWTELAGGTAYTGARQALSMTTAASAGSKTANAASVFPILATNSVYGCFVASVSSGTSGTLYSAGAFTGGNRSVVNGDTLNVTYTATIT